MRPQIQRASHAVTIRVEQLPGLGLRITTPVARGWAAVARTPAELARAMEHAFTESRIASYARQHDEVYDLDAMTLNDPTDPLTANPTRMKRKRQRSPDGKPKRPVLPPEAWTRVDAGTWQSPSGRRYREETPIVQKVIAKRVALGLSA